MKSAITMPLQYIAYSRQCILHNREQKKEEEKGEEE